MISVAKNNREAIVHYGKSTPYIVSEKKWDTKKDKDKSMVHTLYVHTVVC